MEAIGQNLRRLRLVKGWTQEQLAEAANLSRGGYRAIENSESVPRVDNLQELARVLDVAIADLLRPVRALHHVRFRSTKKMRLREQVLSDVAGWLDNFNALENALGEPTRGDRLARVQQRMPRRGPRRAADAAKVVREEFKLNNEPIRDICGLLESNGTKVLSLPIATNTFFGMSVASEDGGPAVVVNTSERISVERRIFTAAHEFGHLLLHLDAYDVDETGEEDAQEHEANVFAAYFLMPEEGFRSEWDDTYGMSLWDRVLKVKRMFGVSYRTVLYRLAKGGLGDEIWQQFQTESLKRTGKTLLRADEPDRLAADAFNASFPESRRAGEPERLSPIDFKEDRLPTLVRKAVERELITVARGGEILGLSLAQMRDLVASWAG